MARSKATIDYKSLDDVDEFKKKDTLYPSLAELCAVQPMTGPLNMLFWSNFVIMKSDKA